MHRAWAVGLSFSLLFVSGCVTAKIPDYLTDKNSYKRQFFVTFEEALQATRTALEDLGWTIINQADPAVYEQTPTPLMRQVILFTDIRQTPMFLGSRYAKMNLILRQLKEQTEIEIRYLTVSSLPFKNIESFKNDAAVARIFEKIADELKR